MIIRNKIISIMSIALIALPLSLLADPKLDALAKQVAEQGKTLERILNTSTAENIGRAAESVSEASKSFSKGTTIKHSLSFSPSLFFGFGACLSLYTAYRGMNNYLYAHKTRQKKKTEEITNTKKAAQSQAMLGFAGLLASALGLYWTTR